MIELTYNFCLLYTDESNQDLRVVGLQIDYTLILANDIFVVVQKKELKENKIISKR